MTPLQQAAQALVDRWDTPLWKDVPHTGEYIDALRAALSMPAGWQAIETAPKDGTEILLSNGVDVAEGHWLFHEGGIRERRDIDGRYIDQDEDEGYEGWIDWGGGMSPKPTHWMPLPAAPSPQEQT